MRQPTRSQGIYSSQEVAREFLRQNSSVDGVVLIGVEERHNTIGPGVRRNVRVDVVLSDPQTSKRLTPHIIQTLDRVLRVATQRFPQPKYSIYNAVVRCKESKFGDDMMGGYKMDSTGVSISSRALQRLLAGAITLEEFHAAHQWDHAGGPTNPFLFALMKGRLIQHVNVESGGDNDDDWFHFTFGRPDPAASDFRWPRAET